MPANSMSLLTMKCDFCSNRQEWRNGSIDTCYAMSRTSGWQHRNCYCACEDCKGSDTVQDIMSGKLPLADYYGNMALAKGGRP